MSLERLVNQGIVNFHLKNKKGDFTDEAIDVNDYRGGASGMAAAITAARMEARYCY